MTRFPSARLNHKAILAFMQRSAVLAGALVAAALTGAQANAAGDGLYQRNAGVEAFIGVVFPSMRVSSRTVWSRHEQRWCEETT